MTVKETNIKLFTKEQVEAINDKLQQQCLVLTNGCIEMDTSTLNVGIRSGRGQIASYSEARVLQIIRKVFPDYDNIILNGVSTC